MYILDPSLPPSPQELTLESSEEAELTILYDSTYCRDKVSRCEEQQLTVEYTKHPQKVHAYICQWQFQDLERWVSCACAQ